MARNGVESLSNKQRECLELVGQGYTSSEIEGKLGISANTVNTHIALAVQKLGAPNRLHAARMLREHRTAQNGMPNDPPENLASQILRLSPDQPLVPDGYRQTASDGEEAEAMTFLPYPPSAPPTVGSQRDDLISVLKTVALIIAIAAGFVIVLGNYPRIIAGAKDIYNAMPPHNIIAH